MSREPEKADHQGKRMPGGNPAPSTDNEKFTFAVLTAPSKGAVASIYLAGKTLSKTLGSVFTPASRKRFEAFEAGSLLYGLWKNQRGTEEDVIVCPDAQGNAEVLSHAGAAALEALRETMLSLGGTEVEPGLAGTHLTVQTRWKIELRKLLSNSPTERVARILLRQYNRLPELLSELNVESKKNESMAWVDFARHLIQPWKIVLTGRPNAGKSSLVNALVGFDRSIVHETPGTTRDGISWVTAFRGWPVELVDTAGIREASNSIEREGVAVARALVESADVLVQVVDIQELGKSSFVIDRLGRLPDVFVINKVDLVSDPQRLIENVFQHQQSDYPMPRLAVSATKNVGVSKLMDVLVNQLVPRVPGEEVLLAVNDWMVSQLG